MYVKRDEQNLIWLKIYDASAPWRETLMSLLLLIWLIVLQINKFWVRANAKYVARVNDGLKMRETVIFTVQKVANWWFFPHISPGTSLIKRDRIQPGTPFGVFYHIYEIACSGKMWRIFFSLLLDSISCKVE